jgi:signal peptide peptidase SppA
MNILARIADRVIGRPLLLHPAKAELIASVLADRIGIGALVDPAAAGLPAELTAPLAERPAANRMIGEPIGGGRSVLYRRANGVGIIPVVGTLTNRGLAIGEDSSGFTSYESLGVQLAAAMADPQVQAVLLDMDSAGGEATGMFGLAQSIRAARAQKPVTAVVSDMAASAAYGLAASATDIVVSPTSITGSIGVVMLHLDQSRELEMKGRKPTMIFAGAHKVDGNPFGPLSENVRADLQREVDTFYARFVDQVSAGRPALTGDKVRGTEARIFIGSEALDRGLADRMGTFEETLTRMSSAINATSRPTTTGGPLMSNVPADTIPRAEHDAALAAAQAATRTATVERIRAILSHTEAKGREGQALVFALDTDMAPEVAAKALAASPLAPAARQPLDARPNPPVPGGAPANDTRDTRTSWDRSLKRMGAKLNT